MMRQAITCPICGGMIESHWQVFDHVTCQPPRDDVPEEELRRQGWQLEKTLNRVGRR